MNIVKILPVSIVIIRIQTYHRFALVTTAWILRLSDLYSPDKNKMTYISLAICEMGMQPNDVVFQTSNCHRKCYILKMEILLNNNTVTIFKCYVTMWVCNQ